MTRAVPAAGPVRVLRGRSRVAHAPPVGTPLPDVAGDGVQAEPVGREGVCRRSPGVAVLARCCSSGTGPARCCTGAARPVSARHPRRTGPLPGRRARHTPTPPRWAAAALPTHRTRARRRGRRARRGGRTGPRSCCRAPRVRARWRRPLGTTTGTAADAAHPRAGPRAGSRAKTNDHPKRSALVWYPVASTKAPNWAFVTVVRAIANGEMLTLRTGPSPSPGLASASAEPIANVPPSRATSGTSTSPPGPPTALTPPAPSTALTPPEPPTAPGGAPKTTAVDREPSPPGRAGVQHDPLTEPVSWGPISASKGRPPRAPLLRVVRLPAGAARIWNRAGVIRTGHMLNVCLVC